MRILLTGAQGQLGRCFKDRLPENWELIATDSQTLNITDAAGVMNMVKNFQPDAVVNAAAYTAVDKAESEHDKAFQINAIGTHNLAAAAQAVGAKFVHVSTDYVFAGHAKTPYMETDAPEPTGVYGKSKLAGELLALAANPNSMVIRTAWVFSEYGNNFVKTMLRLAKDRDTLNVVDDQIGNPTYAGDLAQAIIDALKLPNFPIGLYHYCGDKSVSWCDFARAIFQTAAQSGHDFRSPTTNGIATSEYPTPAARPPYSVMSCDKIKSYGLKVSDWQAALNKIVLALLSESM
ncbi:MAG: dTDP-4-dehydrorhamnose reductase [Neisseria sp.]|uniref:dTDP-4-dehydrorhamnose reductase n=1 Tax=Neisseria sp. TaxID=192066 RepID=UPI0026DCA768|nr:dTDP-4-dehydrorhamnose reductase [Neisseria sp.]MDO4640201.1 dTDP-4-dehydrorhamnose reductase [Neisseria sp.]